MQDGKQLEVRCPHCGHLLGKLSGEWHVTAVWETRCPKCKEWVTFPAASIKTTRLMIREVKASDAT